MFLLLLSPSLLFIKNSSLGRVIVIMLQLLCQQLIHFWLWAITSHPDVSFHVWLERNTKFKFKFVIISTYINLSLARLNPVNQVDWLRTWWWKRTPQFLLIISAPVFAEFLKVWIWQETCSYLLFWYGMIFRKKLS